jgi:membrane-associated protein
VPEETRAEPVEEQGPTGLPWEGRPGRADLVCWLGIMVSGLYYLALIPVKPLLVGRNPVLLELVGGSISAIVTAGAFVRVGHASLVLAVLAAIPGMMMFDPFYWWAGRRWGRRMIEIFAGRSARSGRMVGHAERWFQRFGWPAVILALFLPVPSAVIYAFAGWSGMRFVTFLLLDLVGTLLWIGLFLTLGYSIGQSAVDVAHAISRYALWFSLGLIAVIVAQQMWRSRRS